MAKQTNRLSSKTNSKRSSSSSNNISRSRRPKQMIPVAGVTKPRRRMENGGEWCW